MLLCDNVGQADYVGKSVLIFGKGNAGMETAANLLDVANYVHVTSRSPVRLAIATHYVGDVRLTGRAGSVLEGYQLKSMNGFYDTQWNQLIDYVEFKQVEDDDGVKRIRLAPLEGGLSNLSAVGKSARDLMATLFADGVGSLFSLWRVEY